MKNENEIKGICDIVRETAFELHAFLRHGHLEKVYQNGLSHRLHKKGINFEEQQPLQVFDEDGTILGDYFADFFVEDCLIVELKVCKCLVNEHIGQLLGYMRASKQHHGLLINFGALKFEIRKFIL